MTRRTIRDAIEALDGIAVPVRGVECTIHVVEVPGGRAPYAYPTVAGRYCRAFRSLPADVDGLGGFRMTEADAMGAILLGFGSMHAADLFLAGTGSAHA